MDQCLLSTNRRELLGLTIVGAAIASTAKANGQETRRKFDADGLVQPFAGSTVICHLPQQGPDSACFEALLDIYRELPRHRFARKLSWLPTSSYHMTVFSCANDQDRRAGFWPAGFPADLPIGECNRLLAERLRGFQSEVALPIYMRVDTAQAPADNQPLKICLLPLDQKEEEKLRGLRTRLAEQIGIQRPEHDHYTFHITLAYPIEPLGRAEKAELQTAMQRWLTRLVENAPIIALGAPEYCIFKDMFHFKRILQLT